MWRVRNRGLAMQGKLLSCVPWGWGVGHPQLPQKTQGSPWNIRLSEHGCPASSPPRNLGTCQKCRVPGSTPATEPQALGVGPGGLWSRQPGKG